MQFKRGATFKFAGPVAATLNGQPVTDFTGWTADSHIRKPDGTLIADLVVTFLDTDPQTFQVQATGSTAAWALGAAVMDIMFTSGTGEIAYTDTVSITIVDRVTRPQ